MSCDRKSKAPKTENVTSAAAVDVNDKLSNCLTNSKKILKVSLERHLPRPTPCPAPPTSRQSGKWKVARIATFQSYQGKSFFAAAALEARTR